MKSLQGKISSRSQDERIQTPYRLQSRLLKALLRRNRNPLVDVGPTTLIGVRAVWCREIIDLRMDDIVSGFGEAGIDAGKALAAGDRNGIRAFFAST